MLSITNLYKKFDLQTSGVYAVENVSLQVRPGQIYALIGPNGAGKTTTIKIIVGLYFATAGTVELFGENISDSNSVRNQIGYIPDEPVYYPFLTGWEFLEFVRRIYQIDQSDFKERLAFLFDYYPIEEILHEIPDRYSRGNKQKLSIICAYIRNPKLLVIDEPIVGLDPQSIDATTYLLREFSDKKGMIFLSTHTLSFIEKLADRVGILYAGKLIEEGSISEIIRRGKKATHFSEAFLQIINKAEK